MQIILTIETLKKLVESMEIKKKYENANAHVIASIKKHPNGIEFLELEQPCYYAECNSTYYRYDAE